MLLSRRVRVWRTFLVSFCTKRITGYPSQFFTQIDASQLVCQTIQPVIRIARTKRIVGVVVLGVLPVVGPLVEVRLLPVRVLVLVVVLIIRILGIAIFVSVTGIVVIVEGGGLNDVDVIEAVLGCRGDVDVILVLYCYFLHWLAIHTNDIIR